MRTSFRWAKCQLDVLESCLAYEELNDALEPLPDTLDETYARIVNAIPGRHKVNATRTLQLLLFSQRPLCTEGIVDAIAVNSHKRPYLDPKNRMPIPRETSQYCSSLVVFVAITSPRYNYGDGEHLDADWRRGSGSNYEDATSIGTFLRREISGFRPT